MFDLPKEEKAAKDSSLVGYLSGNDPCWRFINLYGNDTKFGPPNTCVKYINFILEFIFLLSSNSQILSTNFVKLDVYNLVYNLVYKLYLRFRVKQFVYKF